MLHHKGDGKYLYGEWQRDRCDALEDRSKFDDDELTYLEVSFPDGGGRTKDSTFKIRSRRGNEVDIRDSA